MATHAQDDDSSPDIAELLNSNKEVVEHVKEKHPTFFKTLSAEHKPKYLMIGCADARIQPNSLLKLNPGELFIHRNIANQVSQGDLNANAVIQYAIEGLDIDDIIIMGHSKCGGIMASMKTIPFEIVDQWLTSIREIYENHRPEFDTIESEELKAVALGKINVRHQCMNVRKSAAVKRAIEAGRDIQVHGWFLDVTTGLIEELKFNNDYTNTIAEIYSDTLIRLSTIDGSFKKNLDLGWDPCCFDEAFGAALDTMLVNDRRKGSHYSNREDNYSGSADYSDREKLGSIEIALPDDLNVLFKEGNIRTTSVGYGLLKNTPILHEEDSLHERMSTKQDSISKTKGALQKDPLTGFYTKD